MSSKLVTSRQAGLVRRMANAKGVTYSQFECALNDGSLCSFLDSLKIEIEPPEGACIHVLKVKMEHSYEWQDTVDAAGPNTPGDYSVRKLADQFPSLDRDITWGKIILLNFPNGDGHWCKALMWAETNGLKPTNPREILPIGQQYRKLYKELGQNPIYVVATMDCSFEGYRRACYVWWFSSQRGARLHLVEYFCLSNVWFAFRK